MSNEKKYYTKEFLDSVNTGLELAAATGVTYLAMYMRVGKLNVRVKIDLVPPDPQPTKFVFYEGK